MNIDVRNETFMLHPEKVLIWPKHKMMIVADIHLGKAETFLQSGLWLPPVAHQTELQDLLRIARTENIKHTVFLGDLIHSRKGVTAEITELFATWLKDFAGHSTVIIGNHDRPLVKHWPMQWSTVQLQDSLSFGKISFRHEPPQAVATDQFFWCGHIHPKVKLKNGPDNLYLPAFVVNQSVGLLPAYSSLAGGGPFAHTKENRYFVSDSKTVLEVKAFR